MNYNRVFACASANTGSSTPHGEVCAVKCPCDGCNENLLFHKVNWDFPRFVLCLNKSNEVVIPLVYKCKKGHSFRTIDPEYLELLPSLVQKRYAYSANDSVVFSSVCAWSLLIPDSLDAIYRSLRLGRQREHLERVERYCLYVDMVKCDFAKTCFPSPPCQQYASKAGSKLQSFLHPSQKLLMEIRREAVKRFRPEIHASMQAVRPGKRIAIDSNYKNTKKTSTSADVLTAVLCKDGPDKGKVMGFAVQEGSESHAKSAELYNGIADRPGYRAELEHACIDTCCDGLHAKKLMDHRLVKTFNLTSGPKADIFHKVVGVCDATYDSILSSEHRRDVVTIFFDEVTSIEDMNKEYPDWLEYFDLIKLDGTVKDFSNEAMPLDLYARKLIALAQTFRKEMLSFSSLRTSSEKIQKEWLLGKAIEYVGGKHCKFVPKRVRSQEDMLKQIDSYALKWFGYSIEDMAQAPRFDWKDTNVKHVTEANEVVLPCFAVCDDGNRYITLSNTPTKSTCFRDATGTIWLPTTNSFFGKSLMFQVTPDGKVLGKQSVIKAVLNLHQHILKGCLELHSGGYGLDCYQEVGCPVSKGDRKGLVAMESAFGQNELEAHFRVFNLTTAVTTTLGDPELEPRLELSMLYQNHAVDKKHNVLTTPSPLYWSWNRVGRVHQRVFEKPWIEFHTPNDPKTYKPEPFLGYGSYRFTQAVSSKKNISLDEAKEYASRGFASSKSRARWIYHDVTTLYSDIKASAASISSSSAFKVDAAVAKPRSEPAIDPKQTQPLVKASNLTHDRNTSAQAKRKRVVAVKGLSDGPPAKRLGNKNNLMSAYFKVQKPSSKATKTLIRKSTSKVLARSTESPRMEDLAVEVAREVNDKVYQQQLSPCKSSGTFVNVAGVKDVLVKDAKAAAAKKALAKQTAALTRKNKYKRVPIHRRYPVTRDQLLVGIKHERAKKVLSHLKSWKRTNCSSGKGLTTFLPTSK